ncbi:MAG TPA: NmrA family NAD(P)-binding protein [Ferruginibacter sp.]|nr:NmrA family NAD(P)-binding protein [Ferruginibacter sp.]HMP19522.1 NmrA family NAD(P)-binding protein [Ferruginibacter sp.]
MKYVITGGAGNISKPLTLALLKAGHNVTVIGRNADNLKALTAAGASAAIGSVEDVQFLTQAFAGADAVYTMVPPRYDITANWKAYIGQVGANYRDALKNSGVKYVVNLSSVGAHLADGCGPVSGLHLAELALNELEGIAILHLRPGYFFSNFFGNTNMVRQMNILGSNFGGPGFKLVLSATDDIAAVAANALLNHNFTGHAYLYLASDVRTTDEIATVLGEAVQKQHLPWVTFTDEQALSGMLAVGFTEEIAQNYVEMGRAISSGAMMEDYWKSEPVWGNVKLEDFAKQFAAVYLQGN